STTEPQLRCNQGQSPAVRISFTWAPGSALGEAVDRIQALERDLHLPPTVSGAFTGTAQAFQASLSSTPLLVAAAILVVYIVLGVLYESYIPPITILSALPSAGVGALLALILWPRPGYTPPAKFDAWTLFDPSVGVPANYELTVIAIVGVVLLIGIVKKNAIMMIDFALTAERHEGKSPLEAIHEACLLRFRP